MTIADLIVSEARRWIGTPFHHQARIKGKGCDCLGLIVGVAKELKLKDKQGKLLSYHDECNYSRQPNCTHLIDKLSSLLDQIPIADLRPGDIGVFKIGENPQHLAILSEYSIPSNNTGSGLELGMIHSYAIAKRVVEHRMDDEWKSKLEHVFRVS